jgi:hypothetical protein
MVKMNVVISDDIENRFRKTIARYWGFKKGSISRALEEAIELWIKEWDDAIIPKG